MQQHHEPLLAILHHFVLSFLEGVTQVTTLLHLDEPTA